MDVSQGLPFAVLWPALGMTMFPHVRQGWPIAACHSVAAAVGTGVHLSDQSVADAADRVSGRIHAALAGRGAECDGGSDHARR